MKTIDVVFTVGPGSQWNDNELRYALRALERHGQGVGEVFVIGHKPDWCLAVHVPYDDPYPKDKAANLIHKLIYAPVFGEFVYYHDDQILLADVDLPTLPYWCKGELSSRNVLDDLYARRLRNTRRLLLDSNCPVWNYDIHAPMRMDAGLLAWIFDGGVGLKWWHQPQGPGIVVKSIYANLLELPPTQERDCLLSPMKVNTKVDAKRLTEGRPFCSLRPRVPVGVQQWLAERFPEPSRWEMRP